MLRILIDTFDKRIFLARAQMKRKPVQERQSFRTQDLTFIEQNRWPGVDWNPFLLNA